MNGMLAQKYDGEELERPHRVEPKIDGVRTFLVLDPDNPRALSRNGKLLKNQGELLQSLTGKLQDYVIDGETYAGSWEESITAAKGAGSKKSGFWAFDIIRLENFLKGHYDVPDTRRREMLEKCLADRPGVIVTPSFVVNDSSEVTEHFRRFLKAGFEGAMLKDPEATYTEGRGSAWRKVKAAHSLDASIVGFEVGTGKYLGMLGALVIEYEGTRCKVGTGFLDHEREAFWRNCQRLVGRIIEVEYQEKTPGGSLRFPRFKRLRTDL